MLWTNPSPSSSFASQTITLNQSIRNFKYLRFEWTSSPTETGSQYKGSNVCPVSFFVTTESGTGTSTIPKMKFILGGARWTTATYCRTVWHTSDTSIFLENAWGVGRASSESTSYIIPTTIYGLK